MRYLVFTECGPDDADEMFRLRDDTTVMRETKPGKWPKVLFETHALLGELPKLTEKFRQVVIHEADDAKQLEDMVAFAMSRATRMKSFSFYYVPIADGSSIQAALKEQRKASL